MSFQDIRGASSRSFSARAPSSSFLLSSIFLFSSASKWYFYLCSFSLASSSFFCSLPACLDDSLYILFLSFFISLWSAILSSLARLCSYVVYCSLCIYSLLRIFRAKLFRPSFSSSCLLRLFRVKKTGCASGSLGLSLLRCARFRFA